MLSISPSCAYVPAAGMQPGPLRSHVNMKVETRDDLEVLAKQLNPVVGFYDPLNLNSWNLWNKGDAATVGFLRHAEIKHGRVAMAGFVGYIIHENGIRWPWPLSYSLPDYSSFEGLSAPAVWDAIPLNAKMQIILVVGFLEVWSETSYVHKQEGSDHYMKGGKPGYYPTFNLGQPGAPGNPSKSYGWGIAHPVPYNLFDPFDLSQNRSEEDKAKGLVTEINNGRLAMIGLFGFVSEACVPGSVPALKGLVKAYDGNIMAPLQPFTFEGWNVVG